MIGKLISHLKRDNQMDKIMIFRCMACTYVNKSTYEIIIYIYVEREREMNTSIKKYMTYMQKVSTAMKHESVG